ncbi:phosphatidylglycerophosphatase A family protein [Hippea maritima]|uniref:Phosphatidylglycerophosphatase A n=1 Tax=Hippea maritima (strain ATCC 700847 / DSM 10411 / MH2) TaxID=760142 RepID=F2LXN6_HIPMA|nr:phosphatidylglycerophosphatase A [Hippea maritima]AEA33222.1 phosphatidylglycerophosphatase A [Hippea maritima DSM 10411]
MKINEDTIQRISEHISTIFGIGYTAYAPGTMGSLFGLLIYMFLKDSGIYFYAFVVVILFIAGVLASDVMENVYGIKDPSFVIIDEVVGMLISLMAVPYHPVVAISGFFLFRLIDISKVPPLNWLEKLGGGFGIMIDDAVGGLMVNIILQVIVR